MTQAADPKLIYLDYAAATPLDEEVAALMRPFYTDLFFNPSATYLPARKVRSELEKARTEVAGVIGAKSSEVIFTAGGTEANNLAVQGVMAAYSGHSLVISAIEHDSIRVPAGEYNCFAAPVTGDGRVNLERLKQLIRSDTVLISIMLASNEVGVLQPVREISQLVLNIKQQRREEGNKTPLYFHTDACQAGNYLSLGVSRLGVDMMTLNGGKIYGPKQSGALYVASHVQLKPQILGGGQERGLRSGTENVAQAVGFAGALVKAQQLRAAESARLSKMQAKLVKSLKSSLPEVEINGSIKHRLPNNLHLTIPGQDNERMLLELEQRGILAAAGSACSASSDEPSHVLQAMGKTETEIRSSLRFTFGRQTTEEQLEELVSTLTSLASLKY